MALREAIDAHRAALDASGAIAARRAEINERRLLLASEEALRRSFARQRDGHVAGLLAELNERTVESARGGASACSKLCGRRITHER